MNAQDKIRRCDIAIVGGGMVGLSLAAALLASLGLRTPFEANVLRPRGANPFVVDGELVRNVFEIHLVNKSPQAARYRLSVEAPVAAEVVISSPEIGLASLADARVPIAVAIARDRASSGCMSSHGVFSSATKVGRFAFMLPRP